MSSNTEHPGSFPLPRPRWRSKKDSPQFRQPRTTTTAVIQTFPAGYPDQFYPDPVSFSNRHPTRRMLFEAQISELISPGFLQIEDVTMFSGLRKDTFCSITQSDGNAILLARKVMASHARLPLSRRNPVIIQNGFGVKVKNLGGACVLTLERKTMFKSNLINETDIMNIWLGNRVIPVGQIRKPALINEYQVFDEFNNPHFVIHKAQAMTDPNDVKKKYKYIVHKVGDQGIVGQLNCRGRKGFGPLVAGEYPCSTEFLKNLTITQKSLVLGALFLVASRAHSGIEGDEEKLRERYEIGDTDDGLSVLRKGVDNADSVTFSSSNVTTD